MGQMAVRSVLILAAMQMEANAVADALQIPRPRPAKQSGGIVGGVDVSMELIGIGAKRLPDGQLDRRPDVVLLAGLSGALDPSLKVGQIVVEDSIDSMGIQLSHRQGPLESGDQIISTPRQKSELFRTTGALAFDMESGIVRAWAQRHELKYLAVRSISDRADQTVVPEVVDWVDQWGRPRIGSVLVSLLRKPGLINHLRRLAVDSKEPARSLGAAVREIILHLDRQ